MKLIIDIPDNTYANIQEHKRHTGFTMLDLIKAIRHGTPIPDNATVCDIDAIRAEIERVLMDLGTNNAYDMPSFWANKGKDYKVIPTKWHKGYGQAIVDVDNRLKELFDKYTK